MSETSVALSKLWFNIRALMAEELGIRAQRIAPRGYVTAWVRVAREQRATNLREYTDYEISSEYLRRLKEKQDRK